MAVLWDECVIIIIGIWNTGEVIPLSNTIFHGQSPGSNLFIDSWPSFLILAWIFPISFSIGGYSRVGFTC
jgi:hypothetical protein